MLKALRRLFHNNTLRKWAVRIRLPLGIVAVMALVAFIDKAWFFIGLITSAVGAVAQLWCFSCIKTQKILAINGPYRFVRNPMYLARMFLVLGVILMTGQLWFVALLAILYTLYMVTRVEREEARLREVFGEEYLEYCRIVPRFLPVFIRAWPEGRTLYFNWEFFQRNRGVVNLLTTLVLYAMLYVATFYCLCNCR